MAKLVDTVATWAAKPMRPGEGLHTDIFRACIMMLESGHSDEQVFDFVRRAADRVGDRHVPDREIRSAIAYAHNRLSGEGLESPRWPAYNEGLRAEIIANAGVTVEQLAESSEQQSQDPWFYVSRLYRPDEYVCLASQSSSFATLSRDDWQPWLLSYPYEYINPSAMTNSFGMTKENKASPHCLDNCGPKTYQVVEFDFGAPNEHAAILWHLAKQARLICMVYSGGKSLHGWFNVRGWAETEMLRFFQSAVELGADPKMWSRCQFSRLPAGRNTKTGKQQTVLVFEPRHL